MTTIEWTEKVWNPTSGCDRVSAGCDNCYALTMAKRLKGMGAAKYQRDGDPRTSGPGFGLTTHEDALILPLRWRKPKRIFVNSMSDLFHDEIPDGFLDEVFGVMAVAHALHGHTFQVLTKRHARMRSYLNSSRRDLGGTRRAIANAAHRWAIDRINAGALSEAIEYGNAWPLPGVWLGVSVEDQKWAGIRIPALLETPAAVRWLSIEPMLGPIDLGIGDPHRDHESDDVDGFPHPRICLTCSPEDLDVVYFRREPGGYGIDWVVVGGESGRDARPMHPGWVRSLRDECVQAQVPFFFKQWGEWITVDDSGEDGWRARRETDLELRSDGYSWPMVEPHGAEDGTEVLVRRVGKRAAGRLLDGREWSEYPVGVS